MSKNLIWSDPFADLPKIQRQEANATSKDDGAQPAASADSGPKSRKRAGGEHAEEGDHAKKVKAEGGEEHQGEAPAPKVDIAEALGKICKGLSNPKKFVKAVDVFLQLMERELPSSPDDSWQWEQQPYDEAKVKAAAFICSAITEFLQSEANVERLVGTPEEQAACCKLCKGFEREAGWWFSEWDKVVIGTLQLLGPVRQTLATDDSYIFRKASLKIKEAIESLRPIVESADTTEMVQRRRAILLCLRTAFKKNIFAWAKPAIEDVFVAASERRLFFLEAEREELDTMYTKLRNAQRGMSVNPSGTVVSRAVRLVNSTAHPLRNKATDMFK